MSNHSELKETVVDRETCLHKDACKTDACTPADCSRYKTKISARIEETSEGYNWFYRCVPTGKEVGPYGLNEADPFTIAAQLGVRPKAVWYILINDSRISEEKRAEFEELMAPEELSHLNMMEDPELTGKPVIVDVIVSSTSIAYSAPAEVEVTYEDKNYEEVQSNKIISKKDPVNITLIGVNEEIKYRRLKRLFGVPRENVCIKEKCHRTIYRLRVRPPVFTLEKRGHRIVDERGYEYKAIDIFVASDEQLTFHPSSLVRLQGVVLPNPRTQKLTLLVYKLHFPENNEGFSKKKLARLKAVLDSKGSVEARVNWILENFETYSNIVSRRNLAFGGLLVYFTPVHIKLDGDVQRGWGNVLFIGDTTTAKSETLRKLIQLLNAGMLITAETASAVGLTGTTTQIEKEGWFVDWGFLVLSDLKLLAVDGAHKLGSSQWAALAEAERSGVVVIAKAAKNSAYARTRQIKIANAVDRESGKYATRSLASFLYPCQALATILDKTSIARLDLAVFADRRDVSAAKINVKSDSSHDSDLELLSAVLKWSWSGYASVEFTEEAIDAVLRSATELYETFFADSIPVVSIDMKWKLARLSAALAFLTVSTTDYKTVKVTKEHVHVVVDFIRNEYSKAGLSSLAQQDKFEALTKEDADRITAKIVNEIHNLNEEKIRNIYKFIVLKGRITKDQLKNKFMLTENNQCRPLIAALENEELIKRGRGFYPTPRLIEVYKVLNAFNTFIIDEERPPSLDSRHGRKVQQSPLYSGGVKHVKDVKSDDTPALNSDADSASICWICRKLLPKDLSNCTTLDGKYCHTICAKKSTEGRRINR